MQIETCLKLRGPCCKTKALYYYFSDIEHEEEVEYQKVTVDIGGVLKSKCQISGDPDVQYKWYRPKTDADSTPALIVTVRDLFLANFKQSEYGNYTCVAKNAAGTKTFIVEAVPPFGKFSNVVCVRKMFTRCLT